jgi:hypothetical protein
LFAAIRAASSSFFCFASFSSFSFRTALSSRSCSLASFSCLLRTIATSPVFAVRFCSRALFLCCNYSPISIDLESL